MIGTLALLFITRTVDPRALKLLADADSHQQQLRTLTASCVYMVEHAKSASRPASEWRITSDVRLKRPNFVFVKSSFSQLVNGSWKKDTPFETMACDGSTYWLMEDQYSRVSTSKADPKASDVKLFVQAPLGNFFLPDQAWTKTVDFLKQEDKLKGLSLAPDASCDGQFYRVVKLTYQELANGIIDTMDLYIDKNGLVTRTNLTKSDGSTEITGALSDVHLDEDLPESAFAFSPPPGYKEGTAVVFKRTTDDRIGKPAPAIMVKGLDGKTLTLADFRGKTVVLDFWATWCGNCTAKMPDRNKLAEKYKTQNVVFLAVNSGDPEKKYHDWLRRHKFEGLEFVFDPEGSIGKGTCGAYRAGFPSTFVIDPKGNLADVDPEGLQKSIEQVLAASLK